MAAVRALEDANAHFSEYVRLTEQGTSVLLTRQGQPVVALVPAADLTVLEALRAAGPQKGLASLTGGWEGSDELADLLLEAKRSPPRELPPLE